MVYKFIPSIYCDLGDGLWHCFTHMIFINNRFYKDISYLSMDIYSCFTHIRFFAAEQQHFFSDRQWLCPSAPRSSTERRWWRRKLGARRRLGHWKITLECGTLDVPSGYVKIAIENGDL
jgi:hypothetical protein